MNWRLLGKRLLFVIPLVAFLVMATIAAAVLHRAPAADGVSKSTFKDFGAVLPFSLPGLKTDDLKGKPVLLVYFASWCTPCLMEHPVLMQISKKATIYGVDFMDKDDGLANLLKNDGNPFAKIGRDYDGTSGISFGVVGIPTSFVVNAAGHIIYRQDGPISAEDAEKNILPLLEGGK